MPAMPPGRSAPAPRPASVFVAPLLVVALIDELQSGLPVVASPDLQGELSLDAAGLAAALFTAPMLIGTLVEPLLLRLTGRLDRRWPLAAALIGMAICQGWIALAPGAVSLSAAVAVWGIGSGLATTFAEVALIARSDDPHRAMSRWALLGSLGDIGAPALYALCALSGLGWRAAAGIGAVVALIDAALILAGPALREEAGDGEDEDVDNGAGGAGKGGAIWRSPAVWGWLIAAAACTLFDEIFLSMGSLWLSREGVAAEARGLAFAAFSAGMALGQAVTPALLRRSTPRALLIAASAACLLLWPIWLILPGGAIPLSLLLGLAVSPMWALSTAESYAAGSRISGRPSQVAALNRLLSPLEVAAPVLLGLVADRIGLAAALALLAIQPVTVLAAALRSKGAERKR